MSENKKKEDFKADAIRKSVRTVSLKPSKMPKSLKPKDEKQE